VRDGGSGLRGRPVAALGLALMLGACSTLGDLKDSLIGGSAANGRRAAVTGFLGGVVADEPAAVLAGREVLSQGGTAADAAVAMGFTLAVTLPSRAGLGGGGACLAYNPAHESPGLGSPEAIVFTPVAPKTVSGRSDRPASVPMMARGLFALHARYGKKPIETLVAPAEQLARFGTPVSRAFLRDFSLVSGPLLADPNARDVFAPAGVLPAEGSTLIQADLGGTLAQLRVAGIGNLYQGGLGSRFVEAADIAGGGLTLQDLRNALPRTIAPIVLPAGHDSVAFLPPPADGGLAAAASFLALQVNPADLDGARARGLAAAAGSRNGNADVTALLASAPAGATLPALPASTTFAALDRNGNAVVCAATMDNLFGTGRVAPGTGVLLAAAPNVATRPLLAAALAWNSNVMGFRAAIGGSGQDGAALAVAVGMVNALRSGSPMPETVPEPGRANAIACARYLPGSEETCGWATDGRGSGLAVGSN